MLSTMAREALHRCSFQDLSKGCCDYQFFTFLRRTMSVSMFIAWLIFVFLRTMADYTRTQAAALECLRSSLGHSLPPCTSRRFFAALSLSQVHRNLVV